MTGPLADKVALVTGASGGIGRASAVALGAAAATVVVTDVAARADDAEKTVTLVQEAGGGAWFEPLDVTDEAAWERTVRDVVARAGRLDLAHNNAGVGYAAALVDTGLEDFRRVVDINLTGVFLGLKHQIPVMLAAGGGSIVNTASLAGLKGLERGSAYSASKHAVVGLTRSAALELADSGIRVNAVCPAATETAMTAELPADLRAAIVAPQLMKRFAAPSEIGAAVAWLLSDEASFLTGVAFPVDGGATAG
ncbi:3-oxoacyl-[acyl-carrier protein] reductase [Pseudonocardia sp. Ae406_Ps2]|uniref:SDR family NAD(P)-dependent oxidoreductase n=1 Tax=unclassified Pseudonocardia TaxID=2619320 RepID=UPI00094B10BE|nr:MULTISPECIES: SDR family oxidoreductase [unclassified Pseudonocardia]OLM00513.1 3-oxoacyl-[acyl-carrier protein] reductase [Pseudonocardia sp. Ae406_Ps2]OLM07695.1 3-oxoacyl-[acyl-carrier protein] reductase [Pseudonocardia sp. Ae331_Ps2]OLM22085.1 3-oxoacyl-[acyl-carrier protein] reductase [Pseudonocardia sp. Ae706_Ps2]OLM31160.1 3-oxoacyl-[acyl-carrier protein] reductase [Pseudonocardia sp. Ae717_Ps2]